MGNTNMDYEIFSLPEKEVKILDKKKEDDGVYIIEIKGKVIKHKCPKCGGYNTKRFGKGYDKHVVNHIFISNYKVIKLRIYKRRFLCKDCDKGNNTFMERFSFLKENCNYTDIYKQFIVIEREYSSLKELARKFRISESMVYEVINNLSIEELMEQKIEYIKNLNEINLGIDEVSFKGMNFVCTITDIDNGKIIGVVESCNKNDLIKWLDRLDESILEKIKGIASDMNAKYKDTIQEYISNRLGIQLKEVGAKGVADHYHLKQIMNKLILEVYNMNKWMIKAGHYSEGIQNLCEEELINKQKYRTDTLRNTIEYKSSNESYKPITLGFFLSKRYSNLMTMKKEKLTEKQHDRLMQLFSEFDPCGYVYQAWKGKEMLFEAIDKKMMKKIDELIKYFGKSVHYKIVTVGKTLKKRREEIQNYFNKQITNAFTEGKNTKAKLFKRMAYGYKKKENYMKRLLICL